MQGDPRGPAGVCAEWPQLRAPMISLSYLRQRLAFMKYCPPDFKSWRVILVICAGNPVYPSLPVCDITDSLLCKIVWHNSVGLAALGKGLGTARTQSSAEEPRTHRCPPLALARGGPGPTPGRTPEALHIGKWGSARTRGYVLQPACGDKRLSIGQREGRVYLLAHSLLFSRGRSGRWA